MDGEDPPPALSARVMSLVSSETAPSDQGGGSGKGDWSMMKVIHRLRTSMLGPQKAGSPGDRENAVCKVRAELLRYAMLKSLHKMLYVDRREWKRW